VTLADLWNITYGAVVGIGGISVFLLILMIGVCLVFDWTKFRPTSGSKIVKSLDETIGSPITYLPPGAPRGPADQLAGSIRAVS
jgi:hypothetical protein